MPQSLSQIYLHIVFSTKNRQPYLSDGVFRKKLYGYMAGICKNLGCPSIRIGGIEDHVHLLVRFSKNIAVKDFIRDLKRSSSKWIKEENPNLLSFGWQAGYGVFSISPSHVSQVQNYIENQAEHHKKETFQDEFRRLCRKYGIKLDERYVWD